MAKKTLRSAAGAAEDQLKAGAKKLQAQLGTVEKAAGKLATKAKERLPAPADVKPDLPGVRRRLRKATATVAKRTGRTAPQAARGETAAATQTTAKKAPTTTSAGKKAPAKKAPATKASSKKASSKKAATKAAPGTAATPTRAAPNGSWTVADLRAEAKRRGLTGYSSKTKAQLLAQLRG